MTAVRAHSKSSRILVNETTASCDITNYSLRHSRNLVQITTICDDGARWLPGQLVGALALQGLFNSTTGSFFREAADAVGVDNGYLVTALPEGFTVGTPAFLAVSDLSSFSVHANVKDAVKASIDATPDDGIDWGVLLHDSTAETADGTGTADDNAAASTNGSVANLHVTALSGFTSVVFKVQSSPDNSVWSDFITFTTVTAATSERKTTTGAVPRYLRAFWDVTGSGSITFYVAAARR